MSAAKTHDYVQDIVRRFPSANSGPPAGDILPSDKPAFMERVAAELGRLLPGDAVAADGMTHNVTRPGGHAIGFDQSGYYKLCDEANFNCRVPLLQSLTRTAAWLAVPQPVRLRSSLHIMPGCTASAAAEVSQGCTARPSSEPMAPIFRHAFGNLEEVCFKTADSGDVPLTNADRRDMNLDVDAALDLCGKSMRDALGPPASAAGGGGRHRHAFRALRRIARPVRRRLDGAGRRESGGHLIIAPAGARHASLHERRRAG